MSTRLPADWQNRQRLDGTYRLQVAAVEDVSKPRYSVHELSTVKGRAARQIDTEDDGNAAAADSMTQREAAKNATKRCWKLVLADGADRLLLAYEYQKCAITTLAVGDWVELVGPVEFIGPGVVALNSTNLRLSMDATTSGPFSAEPQEEQIAEEEPEDSWIHDIPSDMFHPSSGGFALTPRQQPEQSRVRTSDMVRALDDVIIIDE